MCFAHGSSLRYKEKEL